MKRQVRKLFGRHLNRSQRSLIQQVLAERGYKTRAAAGREIARIGHYETEECASHYLSHALNGDRPVSYRLAKSLLALCNHDERLSFLEPEGAAGRRRSPIEDAVNRVIEGVEIKEDPWRALICGYLARIYRGVMSRKVKARLPVIMGLEGVVKRYDL